MSKAARWLVCALCLSFGFTSRPLAAQDVTVVVKSPISPPEWALLERELLDANSRACQLFADKYVDPRGYLLHTMRWGTLDGPDDAIETFYNWTLLHSLGASDSILRLFKKALDGHYLQYNELRTTKTKLAKNGTYIQDFITQSDFFHTAEGMRGIMFQGLSDPTDHKLRRRMKHFAGLYMNEDPTAPNYDAEHKLIKSIWTGSLGPMMHKATEYDWVGDPVPGRFHILHSPEGRDKMVDLMERYPKMLAHCTEYIDSVGDHPLNMAAMNLGMNAYMLTHNKKYRDWVLEYLHAWKDRTESTGGMIPSNVGLDGTPGGVYDGQWWKGTYGWNFTIFDGEIERIAHRNTVMAASWVGFANGLLLTGDQAYIDVLRKQMDLIYEQKKVEDGKTLLPQMYGDPRGYKYKGDPEWYQFRENLHIPQLTEIYLWSMDRDDLERIPKTGWIGFLEGQNPGYPERALKNDFAYIRRKVQSLYNDPTTADTRLADYLMGVNPAKTDTLTELMLGGYLTGNIWMMHSRVRYFDPENRRSGVPDDVAALVQKLTSDSVTLTLVNVNQVEPRSVIVQAGGYGEHQFNSVTVNGESTHIDQPFVTVRLEPGAGAQLQFRMERYANQPTLAQPWDRDWMTKQ